MARAVGVAACCGFLLAAAACEKDPNVVTRTVNVHVPKACAPTGRLYGVYYGWGDFQPTAQNPAQSKLFLDPGAPLAEIPQESRALVLDASDIGSGDRYLGATRVAPTGDVDLLLWPSGATCALTGSVGDASERSLAVLDDGRVLVTAGITPTNAVPPSFLVDLARGVITQVPLGLLNGRTKARADVFGNGVVVSGGVSIDDGKPMKSAEVFDGLTGKFDRNAIIQLSLARSEHGSVRMKNGDVLLVGGEGESGVLRQPERLDLSLGQATREGLPQLEARRRPIVVRLASGEIMVAGGFDGSNQPSPVVEFLSADASVVKATATLPARTRMDCAAAGGGAVCVIAPEDLEQNPEKLVNTWVVSADRTVTPARVQIDPRSTGLPLGDVRLLSAALGRPVLWTGKTFRRWDPWSEEFVAEVDPLGSSGPNVGQPMITADRGLLFWLEPAGFTVGRRFSVRTDYTSDPLPYALGGLEGLVPDRAPFTSGMTFTSDGGLALPRDATVTVADLRFHDFTLDVDLRAGEALRLLLQSDDGPDTECILPGTGPITVHVTRRGGEVSASAGASRRDCPSVDPDARLGLSLRGGGTGAQANQIRNVRISR